MPKDYYETLGVARDASKDDIKRAYKKLAKQYHPDLNKEAGAAEKFKEINEAASILGDEKKREQYDRFGTVGGQGSGFNYEDYGGFSSFGADFDFGDIFDSIFGGRGGFSDFGFPGYSRAERNMQGSDLRFDMELTLEEVSTGVEKAIVIPRLVACETCNARGSKDPKGLSLCGTCNGNGRVTRTRRTAFGLFQTTSMCPTCQGEGQVIKDPCDACRGEGRVHEKSKIKVKIPAGVQTGTRLRMSGEGDAGIRGNPSGDLYVVMHVKEHPVFEREGDDLYIEVPISFVQAALGDVIEVRTIDGNAKLKIPPGTQTNTIFEIKGKGIPHLRGYGSGSQNVRVVVQVPDKLTKKQKSLLEEFGKESGEESKPNLGFFEKLKSKF